MALILCPECHQTVSDAAAACPHCGYPLVAAAATAAKPVRLEDLGQELSDEIRAALKSAGLGDLSNARVTINEPVVTTRSFRSVVTPPARVPIPPSPTTGGFYGYDYKSKANFFGLPLLAMSKGYDPATGRKRVAKGVVAIGDVAVGVFAMGGLSFGVFAVGGVSVGLVAVGGLSIGLIVAVGGAAIGTVAFGGVAFGVYTLGGLSLGPHPLTP